MGGTLIPGGATFRIWAPRAKNVYVCGDFNRWQQNTGSRLNPIAGGHWAGFFPGLNDGDQYLFYVDGIGTSNYKRDPHGRLLTFQPAFPGSNCVLRNPARFPWVAIPFWGRETLICYSGMKGAPQWNRGHHSTLVGLLNFPGPPRLKYGTCNNSAAFRLVASPRRS
jgi:hypothetical protein